MISGLTDFPVGVVQKSISGYQGDTQGFIQECIKQAIEGRLRLFVGGRTYEQGTDFSS
jgi:hypothetical protein